MGAAPLVAASLTLVVHAPASLRAHVVRSCVLSVCAFAATSALLPVIGAKIPEQKRGCDLLKRPARLKIEPADKTVPESLGLVSGVAFVCTLVLTQASLFRASNTAYDFAHEYSAAMVCIIFAVLLGFVDDILDLEWKYKYALPPLMSLPLLSAYDGGTRVVPPRVCRAALAADDGLTPAGRWIDALLSAAFGGGVEEGDAVDKTSGVLDLGVLYYIYMVLLAVFCTNAINIYAGVNGLESGQTYVIACAIIAMSALELGAVGAAEGAQAKNHLFSVTLMLPFAATTLALLRHNWFPAAYFVGDTFTNYAGMALAVVAILGHFPISLMLLMLPQLLNFAISVPQLFGLRHCPRHRLPTFDADTGLVRASRVNDRGDVVPPERNHINLTLINVVLHVLGPMTEPALCTTLMVFQGVCCAAGLGARPRPGLQFWNPIKAMTVATQSRAAWRRGAGEDPKA
ncbi:glycosyl transferase family 4-domain-containing protein [Pelagophyceae sp. CCMP2097]|nr:glycosyl transferase family 4-domain-containing protein [Pelagophyceae sp. CCMP2097]